MEEEKTPIEPRKEKTKLPLGIRFIANAAIIIFGFLSCAGIYWIWTIDLIKRHGHASNLVFYTMTLIVAFILAVLMRKGLKFANYALGGLFILMGYHVWHAGASDDNPGLLDVIGYASIFIGCFLLLVRVIFRPAKEKTK
ncbi:MAG: hypothetical protein A2Y62_05825 [Candidatus Fischerbacteria bacterium RBG_13_37_8]|uniref:Uncharacterized protein n=1 Tax=Candidatus Fischerbacteria bacterium RBG_13_37_8 TaxID=1817863 RepID=A0A1F5VD70_9BACT|nr:MAG: hypothetical protein A2Y62_05825 [Candidatus Fischerbacteria bacterium RBG_13_37_8]